MTDVDLVQFVLDTLDTTGNGGAWNTSNADHPIRYNRRDGTREDTGEHTSSVDHSEDNVVSVALTNKNRTPIGTEFCYRFEATLSVRLEGTHVNQRGNVDPDSSTATWKALTNELERALDTERTFPTTDVQVLSQMLSLDADLSRNLRDTYRADYTLTIEGYEDPDS